jgi:peptidyl-prolyl cis-trans isomerase SurA
MKCIAMSVAAVYVCAFAAAQAPDLSSMDIVLKSVPDGPVAKIGSHVISHDEFIRFYENELRRVMMENRTNEVPDAARARLALGCVALMIEGRLLYDEGVRQNIDVSAQDIEKEWQKKLAQSQKAILDHEKKEVTEAEVLTRLGYADRKEVLNDIRRALVTKKTRELVVKEAGITVSDADVHKEFEAAKNRFAQPAGMHLQQIFINPKNIPGGLADKDQRARQKAQQALDRLAAGQSFEGVSRAMSDAPDAKTGGDMGTLALTELPPFILEAAGKLKTGEVSGILKSDFGYHIVKLLGTEAAREAKEADAAEDIRAALLAERGADAVHAYCDDLIKKGNKVHVYLELEKNLALNGISIDADKKKP